MTTDRRFSRFNKSRDTAAFSLTEIPDGGVCLSAFLILTPAGEPSRILMGHMNPDAPWDHIGALDPKRVEVHSRGWMLPSSHLIYLESPQDAARRIAREQLDLPDLELSGPQVVSEAYTSRRFPERPLHWTSNSYSAESFGPRTSRAPRCGRSWRSSTYAARRKRRSRVRMKT